MRIFQPLPISTLGVLIVSFWIILGQGSWHPWSLWYLCTLSVIFVFSMKTARPSRPKSLFFWFGLVVITGLSGWLRFKDLGTIPIWSDEDDHVGRLLRNGDTFLLSIDWAQQPPIFYYLTALSMKLQGYSLFAIRLPSAILGTLAIPLMSSTCFRFSKNIFLSMGLGLYLATHPALIGYSQEAKPYSAGIFFFAIFLQTLARWLTRTDPKGRSIQLGAASALFLFSIGLQPPLLLASIYGGLALTFWASGNRNRSSELLRVGLAACALYTPLLILLFVRNPWFVQYFGYSQFPEGSFPQDILGDFIGLLGSFRAPLLAGVTFSVLVAWQKFDKLKPRLCCSVGLTFGVVLFPIVYTSAFLSFVRWSSAERYILLFLPLAALASTTAAAEMARCFFEPRSRFIFLLGIFLCFLGLARDGFITPPHKPSENKWHALYQFLKKENPSQAIALVLNANEPTSPTLNGFIGLDYPPGREIAAQLQITSRWDAEEKKKDQARLIIDSIFDGVNYETIYLLSPRRENGNSNRQLPLNEISTYHRVFSEGVEFWSADLFKISTKGNFHLAVKNIFLHLNRSISNERVKESIWEVLVAVYLHEKDCKSSGRMLELIESSRRKFLNWREGNWNYLTRRHEATCKK